MEVERAFVFIPGNLYSGYEEAPFGVDPDTVTFEPPPDMTQRRCGHRGRGRVEQAAGVVTLYCGIIGLFCRVRFQHLRFSSGCLVPDNTVIIIPELSLGKAAATLEGS